MTLRSYHCEDTRNLGQYLKRVDCNSASAVIDFYLKAGNNAYLWGDAIDSVGGSGNRDYSSVGLILTGIIPGFLQAQVRTLGDHVKSRDPKVMCGEEFLIDARTPTGEAEKEMKPEGSFRLDYVHQSVVAAVWGAVWNRKRVPIDLTFVTAQRFDEVKERILGL